MMLMVVIAPVALTVKVAENVPDVAESVPSVYPDPALVMLRVFFHTQCKLITR